MIVVAADSNIKMGSPDAYLPTTNHHERLLLGSEIGDSKFRNGSTVPVDH